MIGVLLFVGLTLAVAAILARPLLRRDTPPAVAGAGIAVYRDQLAEVERERAAGTLPDAEAAAARLEIERRLLAAARAPAAPGGRINRALALPLVLMLVAASAALYLQLGRPGLPDHPYGAAALAARTRLRQAVVAERASAQAHPADPEAWIRLGRTASAAGDPAGAAEAYGRALPLAPDRADIAAAQGAALVEAAGGQVDAAARNAFETAMRLDPRQPRARYFLALARAQGGDLKGAIADWAALARAAPPDAPYLGTIRAQVAQAAQRLGLDPAGIDLGAPADNPALAAHIAALPEADRRKAIEGMVAGLAARLERTPDDVPGWLRLANAYKQLGQPERARTALAGLATRVPDRVDVQVAYAEALYPPETAGQAPPPPEFLAVMHHVLALDPSNAEALWFVARDTAASDPGGAKLLLTRLLARLPPDSPVRATVEKEVARLGG